MYNARETSFITLNKSDYVKGQFLFKVVHSCNIWKNVLSIISPTICTILCFVDRAFLYNLVNKANLVHNFSYYVYFFSLHVSGSYVPIIRRNNCICATLGICHSVWTTVWYTRQSSTQSDKYQVSHRYSYFSWWWAHSRPKYVEKRNKHNKKNCAPSWLYLQDYTRMHGQQSIKLCIWLVK